MIIFILIVTGAFIMLIHFWVNLIDDVSDNDYDYCEGCSKGMCFDHPKDKNCKRWLDENKNQKSIDNNRSDSGS